MKRKKKDERDQMTFKRTWQNMFFALGIVWKCSPLRLIYHILSTVIGALFSFLTGTWLTRYIFNGLQNDIAFNKVAAVLCGIYGSYIVFNIFCAAFNRIMTPILKLKVAKKLNHMLFEMVANVDLSCYDDTKFYEKFTMTIPEAMGKVDDFAMYLISWFLDGMVHIITNAAIIVAIEPVLILLSFAPLVTNLIFGKRANKMNFKYEADSREIGRSKDYVNRVFYLADYAKETHMSSIGTVMVRKLSEALKRMHSLISKDGFKRGAYYFFSEYLIDYCLIYFTAIIYAAYCLIVKGSISIGDCIVISGSITTVSGCISWVSDTYIKMRENSLFLDNMREFLAYEPKVTTAENAEKPTGDPEIKFDNVSFRYDNTDQDVLKNISFTLNKGEKIALVGANGAGKSTLVKLMMRLYDTTEGKIFCNGADIKNLELESYRDLYGVVFQDYRIFAMSVRNNVLLGYDRDDDTVIEALKAAGVYERIMELPEGIDTILTREYSEDGTVLSGGEYQKICVARVFARNAPIVILDEPSSALDPIAEYEMYENLLKMCEGRSAVFISHRLSSATLADKVLMMEKGEIVEYGSHSELMAKGGKYAEMFAKQAESYIEGEGEENEE